MAESKLLEDRILIGYEELEQVYGIKKGTAASFVSRKQIPHVKLGPRNTKFYVSDIEEWLKGRYVKTDQA